jgi:hypothetical protein
MVMTAKLSTSANRLLIRTRVGFFEIFTRISEILTDPTADEKKPPVIKMTTKTITCDAPKSLMVFVSMFILFSSFTYKIWTIWEYEIKTQTSDEAGFYVLVRVGL